MSCFDDSLVSDGKSSETAEERHDGQTTRAAFVNYVNCGKIVEVDENGSALTLFDVFVSP